MCKNIYTVIALYLFFSFNLFSENLFNEFVNISDWVKEGETVRVNATFTDIKDGKKTVTEADIIMGKEYKAVYLINKNKKNIFLANKLGYYILSLNQVSPMKISGSYNMIGAASANDIISLDFSKDYEIDSEYKEEKNKVHIKRINNSVPYAYAVLQKEIENGKPVYKIVFEDANKRPIKKAVYTVGYVSNILTIKKMEFMNLVINTNLITVFDINSTRKINISQSYFRSENMKMLFTIFENKK